MRLEALVDGACPLADLHEVCPILRERHSSRKADRARLLPQELILEHLSLISPPMTLVRLWLEVLYLILALSMSWQDLVSEFGVMRFASR